MTGRFGIWAAALTAGIAVTARADLIHTWVGPVGGSYHVSGHWNPAGPPGTGATGVISGAALVQVGIQKSVVTGSTVRVEMFSEMYRGNEHSMHLSEGSLSFLDMATLRLNSLRLHDGAVFNWHSTGSWTMIGNAPAGQYGNLELQQSGLEVNMSAGLWTLTGSTNSSVAFWGGTFNMTGGRIEGDQRFRIGHATHSATMNMSGNAEFINISDTDVASQLWMVGDGRLNMSDQSRVVVTGMSLHSDARIHFYGEESRLFIKGDWVQYILDRFEQFLVEDQANPFLLDLGYAWIDQEEYTYVGAIPEPSATWLVLAPGFWLLRRRRRR